MKKLFGFLFAAMMFLTPMPIQAHLVNVDCSTDLPSAGTCWKPVVIQYLRASFTPAATPAAIGVTSQTFTFTGIYTSDFISILPSASGQQALCPAISASVNSTNTLKIYYATLTAAACTPTSGIDFLLIRKTPTGL